MGSPAGARDALVLSREMAPEAGERLIAMTRLALLVFRAVAMPCAGWTSSTPGVVGQTGRADRTDEGWTDTDVVLVIAGDCSQIARLYCFEK